MCHYSIVFVQFRTQNVKLRKTGYKTPETESIAPKRNLCSFTFHKLMTISTAQGIIIVIIEPL